MFGDSSYIFAFVDKYNILKPDANDGILAMIIVIRLISLVSIGLLQIPFSFQIYM